MSRPADGPVLTLYSIPMSHPARAAASMLRHTGIEHRVRQLPAGLHPLALRTLGFEEGTVPAMRIGDRRVQGSLRISRALHELPGAPLLFPAAPEPRRRVEEAERWGEAVYQPLPRQLFRWGATLDAGLRVHMARGSGLPFPRTAGRLSYPVAAYFARAAGADRESVRAELVGLAEHLERIDALIEEGVLGGEEPNAADFQIAPTTRTLMNFPQLRALLEGRPAAEHAMAICPDFGTEVPFEIPPELLSR